MGTDVTKRFGLGVVVLALGIPIGDWIAKVTKEELKAGQIWFKLIIIICLVGAIIFLLFGNDALLFALLFIAIVTSRSLVAKKKRKRKR